MVCSTTSSAGDAGWQPVSAGPLGQGTDLGDAMQIDAYAPDGTALAATGPQVIAPGGDAAGFRIALQIAGQRRLVLFDGLNAREINAEAGEGDDP